MNRNFFVADPDAFSVSKQTIIDHPWHGGTQALTLDESRVAIALAAVSGGMFEIGDDLPTAYLDPDRMALLENRDLINMARYGHAAKPLDLMSYAPEDGMPSTFLLRESKRQSILAVFNWTESSRKRVLTISDLESRWRGHNQIVDVLDPDKVIGKDLNSISLNLAPHSVRMLKIVDTSVPAAAPAVTAHFEDHCTTGVSAQFSADADPEGVPVVQYLWDFGDGTREKGASVVHTFTHEGTFKVQLRAESIEGLSAERSFQVTASGRINTRFRPETFRRYVPERR
jgi:hypothetical protein